MHITLCRLHKVCNTHGQAVVCAEFATGQVGSEKQSLNHLQTQLCLIYLSEPVPVPVSDLSHVVAFTQPG